MTEKDRTAQTEPLTIGQRIVAKWEGPACEWSEPADLAEAIDAAIAEEREQCATVADEHSANTPLEGEYYIAGVIASAIRARST